MISKAIKLFILLAVLGAGALLASHFAHQHPLTRIKQVTKLALRQFEWITHVSLANAVQGEIKFEKIALPNTADKHTSLAMGPDGKLYASTMDGRIKRFALRADGTLDDPEVIYTLQDASGQRVPRLIIGLAFDPAATADSLVVWVTHSASVLNDGPDWDGKLTRLSGPHLEVLQDVLIHLPRSVNDHLSNSIAFGPDSALYFVQGSNTAMGAPDETWGYREEHLLSAAVLRLDLSKYKSTLPLDVKTAEGGTYNPYAADAPLTIFASGIRNGYDLLWHSNGELYVPNNGSAPGGNTPASVPGTRRPDGSTYKGPKVPAMSDVRLDEKDHLYRVEKGGYYGHPNPARGEYVMQGGNPTLQNDPAQVESYPAGTLPDPNWRGSAFEFSAHNSPNGIIEYHGNAFNSELKGKIMVARLVYNSDILILEPGGSKKDIIRETAGATIPGLGKFLMPLDLTEDVNTGNIYVAEFGGNNGRIVLLRPVSENAQPLLVHKKHN
ncbi:PQQ-dependent sugar dehydrogenase [Pontibacter sp. 172403-2]|uniref:PQQ-dependent sugar dehydrogenase n=1 Tax=Pontibacter rufus TaxID=2791028 RepID=UPI0018B004B3|nr:PQQ-dependent sugar dehydrogenase [Pontibacter sp. 172403-2]MBF9253166.1 PQQ-dependent sugar dehydrogenase [Pontibacter sp. 172403-2]